MRLVSLASGSRGNATLLCAGETRILVDCGIAAKRADESLKALGIEKGLGGIDALLLTHEHTDHIKGVKRLMSAWQIPVYAGEGTLKALAGVSGDDYFRYAGRALMEPVRADFELEIGDISILPFATWHDAAEPYAYRFEAREENGRETAAAVLTDCGHYDDYIAAHLTELDALLLEANHDLQMLARGPYPMMLKRRILSPRGHLSNLDAGELLSRIFAPRLKSVLLGHLSMENNTQKVALDTVAGKLRELRGQEAVSMITLDAAPQNGISRDLHL